MAIAVRLPLSLGLVAALSSALGSLGCDPGGECVPGAAGCAEQEEASIRVNSVGFFLGDRKLATLVGDGNAFRVVSVEDERVVAEGAPFGPLESPDTAEQVYVADFTELDEEGTFVLEFGARKSAPFAVGTGTYDESLVTLLLGVHGQRCGTPVRFTFASFEYAHGTCHEDDGGLMYSDAGQGSLDGAGGWHDAGDYGKYVVNGAFALGQVLKAWEHFAPVLAAARFIPGREDAELPDVLDEAKWELDFLVKMQFEDGSVSHKLTALNFEALSVMPEADRAPRYFSRSGIAATADFAAVAAMSARIFAAYAPQDAERYGQAALDAYAYLLEHPTDEPLDLTPFTTGGYQSPNHSGERLWAAAEIWETFGDERALRDVERLYPGLGRDGIPTLWDWGDPLNLGLFTYLFSERPGRRPALVRDLAAATVRSADTIAQRSEEHAYGRGVGPAYFWGINGTVARTTFNLEAAFRLTGNPRYLVAWGAQLDHLFGRNYYGRSQATGIGADAPNQPHHRPSVADNNPHPWPGLLVGGSWSDAPAPAAATSWQDTSADFETNEVAINWNTALIYAVAGWISHHQDTSDRAIARGAGSTSRRRAPRAAVSAGETP
ncbi:MAG TPA: glycoside hydrolase family 9 protein [Polyangiaceae bacterium]